VPRVLTWRWWKWRFLPEQASGSADPATTGPVLLHCRSPARARVRLRRAGTPPATGRQRQKQFAVQASLSVSLLRRQGPQARGFLSAYCCAARAAFHRADSAMCVHSVSKPKVPQQCGRQNLVPGASHRQPQPVPSAHWDQPPRTPAEGLQQLNWGKPTSVWQEWIRAAPRL